MDRNQEIADVLAGLSLFSDLATPQVRAVVELMDEASFQAGDRVLRQGLTGSGFYLILDGEASVVVDGEVRATLSRGDFFGEVSILLGEPPTADIVAASEMRCLVISAGELDGLLMSYPRVMYRMMQAQARRLRRANQWRS
ncbi:MAG: family transcriptional regulator, cyclic receptor protein [Chloroflexota bacterium]|jgi:CRP-like cAMP-binding protein|nr:family transcriptional regulator, cyclic receptor protein [Chloroflexota bacterium]